MRDQQCGNVEIAREFSHQIKHLALAQGVERRGRLIGDQQLGTEKQYGCQHDALAHASGELMRMRPQATLRIDDAHPVEHRDRLFAAGVVAESAMQL